MFLNDRFKEPGQIGRVGAGVEGSIALEQQFQRRQERDIELQPVGAGSADGVQRQHFRLGANRQIDGANRESRLASEKGHTGSAALAIAVPEDADHTASSQRPQRRGDSGLSGGQELNADCCASGVDGIEMTPVVQTLDEGYGRDVECGQGLDRNLGIGDVSCRQDDAAAGSVSVEQVVESGDVQVAVEVTQKVPYWLRLTTLGQPGHGSRPREATRRAAKGGQLEWGMG